MKDNRGYTDVSRDSLVGQRLKHLPAVWETWVQSLGWEDPLGKEIMATHSSILVFWPGEFHGLYGVAESDTTERLHTHTLVNYVGLE